MDLPAVASRLDESLGLTLAGTADGVVTLRLEPSEVGVVEDDELSYLHGGTLATCVDTAAWYAAASASQREDWLVVGLQLEALRLARDEPHRVTARCIRAGRTRAVVDVEIASERDPSRIVAVGRASLAHASR
jgi:uncharacterized protein (TIGR00369 family)